MPVSQKHKIIFIHIPRTGGTSIEQALDVFGRAECGFGIKEGRAMQHYLYSDYREMLTDEALKQYYKFSVIRNPYERFVSVYHWCEISDKTEIKNIGRSGGQSVDDFITYCEKIVKAEDFYLTAYHDHMMPQHRFVYDGGKLMVDKLFAFEDFHEVAGMLKRRCGVALKKAAETTSNYGEALGLTRNQKKRIYEIYEKDFELLGYPK